jgi:chromosome segregation ATPase
LQFCHLALRTVDENKTLDDQRQNLASIHQTAGEIRQLIDKLPPAEQAKAQEIVGHMDDAVRRQGRSIADRLQRSEDTAESIRDGTLSIERGLSGLQSELGELRELPARVHAIGDALHGVESHGVATEQTLAEVSGKIAAVQKSLDGLSNRPPPSCPACVCGRAALASTAPHADGSAN